MDHVFQVGMIGPPTEPMLEAYSTLGYLAGATEHLNFHALVTAATYREPGLLAKIVASLATISGGRIMLGIGAGWFEEEATGIGLSFPPLAERFERLEETLQICHRMWAGDESPFVGRHYRLEHPICSPRPAERPRIIIGGAGEHKTLRLVARYADACNIYFGLDIVAKLKILAEHCAREGRSYDEIEKTSTMLIEIGEDGSGTRELLSDLRTLRNEGITFVYGRMHAADYLSKLETIGREVIPVIAEW
jgi:F420-dependent oxidoreductase-like protein